MDKVPSTDRVVSVDKVPSTDRAVSTDKVPSTDRVLFHEAKTRLFSNRRQTLGILLGALCILGVVVISGMLLQNEAIHTDFSQKNLAPSPQHLFGTDWMGRDMFVRTISGLSLSVLVGLFAAAASSVMAVCLGIAAGLGGKRVDAVITWIIDLLMGLPHIILLILISFALGKGFWGVTIGVALTHWPTLARVIRAEVLQCKQSNFVAHSAKLGATKLQIAARHMVPYIIPQLLVGFVLMFPHAILHEAAVTFLGFGMLPEQPAIGIILSEAMGHLSTGMWWLAVFPGVALIAVVLLFDLAGSSLRKLIDPHSSQE